MKKLNLKVIQVAITSIILLISSQVSSQSAKFPTDSAIWQCYHNYTPDQCYNAIYDYRYTGDSLIGGVHYSKVISEGYSGGCFILGYEGALRYDSVNNIVFIILPDSINEQVLYDFNMQIGDTINGPFHQNDVYQVVSIDTVVYAGISRKRWMFGSLMNTNPYIVEGIGNIEGLFTPLDRIQEMYSLVCFSYKSFSLYPDSNYVCQTFDEIKNVERDFNLNIYPNPIHDEALFVLQNCLIQSVKLYNILGENIFSVNVNTHEFRFNRSNLPNGIYYSIVHSENRDFKNLIFIN